MNKEYILSQLDFKSFYQSLVINLKENGKAQALGLCPFHDDHNPSLSISLDNGLYNCFACNAKGDVFKFYQDYKKVDFKTALKEIAEMQGIADTTVKPKTVATYEYRDSGGKTLYIKERIEPARNGRSKEFIFKHLEDGKPLTARGGDPVLYNLPQLIKSKYAFMVEGETKADLLMRWGLTAVCLDSGANSPFRDDYLKFFEGKEKIIILPDNDSPGRAYADKIASALHGKVGKIKIVELPEMNEAEDIIDWAKVEGNDKEKLLEIVKASPEWQPVKEPDLLSSLESWQHIQSLDIKVEWIVDRVIPKESITLVFGKGGIGKTWLTLDMARCIGSGIPFLGLAPIKAHVIFIDFENPLAVLNTRTQKLGDAENVHFWRASNEKIKPPKLDSNDWEEYKKLPKGSVLIFDTLRASHGKDENASDGMSLIMGRLKELRDMGFTIILLHHTAKNSDKVAKGSTAIVDLADHILGLTLVKKKQGGQDIVIEDDEDTEDEAVYKFGVREKTRFEPYHIYLTLNPDRGFELAPDPQEDTLKEMHSILAGLGKVTKTVFIENCRGLGVGINKLRRLVELGQGRYWKIEAGDRHTYLVSPFQSVNSTPLYRGVDLTNWKNDSKNTAVELDSQNTPQTLDSPELVNSTEGVKQINQLDKELNLREGEL